MKWSGSRQRKALITEDKASIADYRGIKRYGRSRWAVCAAVSAAICLLAGCGDDISVTVPAVNPEQLVSPIMGEADGQVVSQEQESDLPETEQGKSENDSKKTTQEDLSGATDMTQTSEEDSGVVTITISAAGDVTLGNHKEQDYSWSFRQMYDQAEDKGYFFENVLDVFSSDDMTIVNLEGPLTLSENFREGQIYSIKGDPEYAELLNYGSVEAVSMGNNHRLDYGEEGSRDTVEAVEEAGIVYAFDDNVGIYEVKGIRIGFVSVNEVYWGAGVEKTIQSGIEKLKEEEVDLILACCHWGTERENYPEDYQKSLGRKCIDWGADLVIGHHPHVLQGVDRYQGKYIIYSLGNFCFGANRNPPDKDTMIFQQTFTFRDGEKQEDEDVKIIPCSVSSVASRNDFRPTLSQGEDASRIIDRINEYSRDFGVAFAQDGTVIAE